MERGSPLPLLSPQRSWEPVPPIPFFLKGFPSEPVSLGAHTEDHGCTMNQTLTETEGLSALRSPIHSRWETLLLLILLFAFSWSPSQAATLRWTGAHVSSSHWSRGANWDSGSPPQDGDTIVFPGGAARLSNTNDIANLHLVAVRFSGASGGYALFGNGFTITNSITATNSAGSNGIAVGRITLGRDLPFTVAQGGTTLLITSEVRLNGHTLSCTTVGGLELGGAVTGDGSVIKNDNGTLTLSGPDANTFTGDLIVNGGLVLLNKTGGLAVPHRMVVGGGPDTPHTDQVRNLADDQVNEVTIHASGLWDLNGNKEVIADLELNSGGDVDTGASGELILGIGADVTVIPDLTGLQDVSVITGNLTLLLGAHVISVAEGPVLPIDATDLRIDAVVSGLGGITKEGAGDLLLTGNNSFSALATVNGGDLRLGHSSALGGSVVGTIVNNDAALVLLGNLTIADEPLTLNSTGRAGPLNGSAVVDSVGTNQWSGEVRLERTARIDAGLNAALNFAGPIAGPGGITKEGDGTLQYSSASGNSYRGTTTVQGGTLWLDNSLTAFSGDLVVGDGVGGPAADRVVCNGALQLPESQAVTIQSSGRLKTFFERLGSLAGSGELEPTALLHFGLNNASTTFDGHILPNGGVLYKYGTGVWTFNGQAEHNFTYLLSGDLVVNGDHRLPNLFVNVLASLSGEGQVGVLECAGDTSPGRAVGRLTVNQLHFFGPSTLRLELNGPLAGTSYDQLRVVNTADLGSTKLNLTLQYPPTIGESLIIVDHLGVDPIVDRFDGLPEGATIRVNQVPFVVSYHGGDGNDVSLTATNVSVSITETRIEGGNGNGIIDPGECNELYVGLMNETSTPMSVSRVVLDTTTPGVFVTQQNTAYPGFAPLGRQINRVPFELRTLPGFDCGRKVELLLTLTLDTGAVFSIPLSLPSGGAGAPARFDNGANLALVDLGLTSAEMVVSNVVPYVGKVSVSLHATHPASGDLVLRLRSPSGTTVKLASNLGGTTDNYGTGCGESARTTFDDAAAVKIAAGVAPFVGSFTPEVPLSAFLGEDPNGTWTLLVNDTVAGDTGELRCWSLLISPPECSSGGGNCEGCVTNITATLSVDSSLLTQRLVRDGVASLCGSPKACPGSVAGLPLRYRTHTFTNNGPATCVTVAITDRCRTNAPLHASAYLTRFDSADLCARYLGDLGSELRGSSGSFSFPVPADSLFVVVVTSPAALSSCGAYGLEVHGLPCPVAPPQPCPEPRLSIRALTNNLVELSWPACPVNFYQVASSTNLQRWTMASSPMAAPSQNGIMTWTTELSSPQEFFRLIVLPVTNSVVPTQAGVYRAQKFVHAGITRQYRLNLPTTYTNFEPAPLMLALHGHNQTADSFSSNIPALGIYANSAGVILVFPDGTEDERGTGWNILPSSLENPVDDVGFLLALIDHLDARLNIDRKRVYAGGFSNGGQMCHRLAAATTNVFAAFAAVGSAVASPFGGDTLIYQLPPSEPRPVMIVNATNDCKRPYWGGLNEDGVLQPPARDSVTHWTNANLCVTSPIVTTNTIVTNHVRRVFADSCAGPYPAFNAAVTNQVIREHYQLTCAPGTEVVFVTLTDGGHAWTEAGDNVGFDASREVLEFFLSHLR
jgi:autotransporter-associated beta strand protein